MPRGFLLHSRPFRETSLIATFLTDTDGRLDVLVRAGRARGKRRAPPPLPFCLYELSWVGRTELKHLQYFEPADAAFAPAGQHLYCCFYLNELLWRLLPEHEPEPILLQDYTDALQQLAAGKPMEPVLRRFEWRLLTALGYGLDFSRDNAGELLRTELCYRFVPQQGLAVVIDSERTSALCGSGEEFLAIAESRYTSPAICRLAKAVLRAALALYLGGRPLRSRELFVR